MSITNRYLAETLCRALRCNCDGGCILKSMKIENKAEMTVEPYDDRFDVDRAIRTLKRRRKAILKALGSDYVTATIYDEYRMCGAYAITKDGLQTLA